MSGTGAASDAVSGTASRTKAHVVEMSTSTPGTQAATTPLAHGAETAEHMATSSAASTQQRGTAPSGAHAERKDRAERKDKTDKTPTATDSERKDKPDKTPTATDPHLKDQRDEEVRAAAERARNGEGGDASERADALRAEIEQTRAELGETAAALAAKMDVPGRIKQATTEKTGQIADTVAEKSGKLADTVAEKSGQIADTVAERSGQIAATVADKGGRLAESAGNLASKAEPARLKEAASNAMGSLTGKSGEGHGHRAADPAEHGQMRQTTAETRTHLAESAADAAERATTAIGTLPGRASEAIGTMRERASSAIGTMPDRMSKKRRRYALIGAGLVVAAIAVALIRRLR